MVLIGGFMKLFTQLTFFLILTSFCFAQDFENVQVLPFEKKKDLMKYMKKTVSKSLGVKCKFCHNIKDYTDDSNPHKLVAREMMRMVISMNTHLDSAFAAGLKAGMKHRHEPPKVECWVCHKSTTDVEFKKPD
jgi:hypothetical protein